MTSALENRPEPCKAQPAADRAVNALPAGKVVLSGVPIDRMGFDEAMCALENAITADRRLCLSVINVAKLVNLRRDAFLRQSVLDGDFIFADGMPLVWLSRLIGRPLPERVAGIDLMFGLLRLADRRGLRVYLLGAKPEVVNLVARRIGDEYPGAILAGTQHGYFSDADEPRIAATIETARPHILLVAMSSPRKEIFMNRWGTRIAANICHGVGGSFDVFAGITRRAPQWMQRAGLEWFYRLSQEPRRMWKRYLITNTRFVLYAAREIVSARLARRT